MKKILIALILLLSDAQAALFESLESLKAKHPAQYLTEKPLEQKHAPFTKVLRARVPGNSKSSMVLYYFFTAERCEAIYVRISNDEDFGKGILLKGELVKSYKLDPDFEPNNGSEITPDKQAMVAELRWRETSDSLLVAMSRKHGDNSVIWDDKYSLIKWLHAEEDGVEAAKKNKENANLLKFVDEGKAPDEPKPAK